MLLTILLVTYLMAESEEELKSLLMKVKEDSEKAGLKLSIQKLRSWHQILSLHGKQMEKNVEMVSDFILGSQINVDSDCSHLFLGRTATANLDSVLKSRVMTVPTKICIVKAMLFPVVMYGYMSWTIKKAEHQTIDTFKLWCWKKFLRVLRTARRSNQ